MGRGLGAFVSDPGACRPRSKAPDQLLMLAGKGVGPGAWAESDILPEPGGEHQAAPTGRGRCLAQRIGKWVYSLAREGPGA